MDVIVDAVIDAVVDRVGDCKIPPVVPEDSNMVCMNVHSNSETTSQIYLKIVQIVAEKH